MKVRVEVQLDDGTRVERTFDVSSSGNPLFWSRGIEKGALKATASVVRMIEAEYGRSSYEGTHVVCAG